MEEYKQHIIKVNKDFVLPELYSSDDTESIQLALTNGYSIYTKMGEHTQDTLIQKIVIEKNKIIEDIKNDKLTRENTLLKEIEILKNAKLDREIQLNKDLEILRTQLFDKEAQLKRENEQVLKEFKLQALDKETQLKREIDSLTRLKELEIKETKANQEVIYSRKIEELKNIIELSELRMKNLELSRDKEIKDAVNNERAVTERLIKLKDEQIESLKEINSNLDSSISKHSTDIDKLISSFNKTSTSKAKGTEFEKTFKEILIRAFGLCKGFSLIDTSKSSREMDFTMNIEDNVVMWEVKDYATVVPMTEVDKFVRDLKSNASAKIGVFVSRNTDISTKNYTGNLRVEFDDDKLMIFINSFEEFEDDIKLLQTLTVIFSMWWNTHSIKSDFNREEIIKEIESLYSERTKINLEWKMHKGKLVDMVKWVSDTLENTDNRLEKLIKKARGITASKVPIILPPNIFREIEDEEDKEWVMTIMNVCETGEKVNIADISSAIEKTRTLKLDTIKRKVKGVLLDTAIVKEGVNKVVKGLKLKTIAV